MRACVCVLKSVSERTYIISKDRRDSREEEIFRVSLSIKSRARSLPFCASCQIPRPSASPRAESDKCKPSTTYIVDHVVRLVPALPACARPSCNPCQLVPPPRPVRPREKSTRDRYLRGKMALCYAIFRRSLAVRILIHIFGVQHFCKMLFYREF